VGDGLDGDIAVRPHHLDAPGHVARLERVHHPRVVLMRFLGVPQAVGGNVAEIAEQPVASGATEGDEMELAIKVQVLMAYLGDGHLPHLAVQPAYFLKIVTW
jgi:hypothetical protein